MSLFWQNPCLYIGCSAPVSSTQGTPNERWNLQGHLKYYSFNIWMNATHRGSATLLFNPSPQQTWLHGLKYLDFKTLSFTEISCGWHTFGDTIRGSIGKCIQTTKNQNVFIIEQRNSRLDLYATVTLQRYIFWQIGYGYNVDSQIIYSLSIKISILQTTSCCLHKGHMADH